MAVYFDHQIQAPGQGGHSLSAWHSNFPILAVASSDTFGGSVNLYMEEVEFLHFRIKMDRFSIKCKFGCSWRRYAGNLELGEIRRVM